MATTTKKIAPAKKRKSNAREPVLREVNAIDFQTLSALSYFPSIPPDGDGEMPISAAVHWIASEGRKIDHDLLSIEGEAHYCTSAKALFKRAMSEKVRVFGENLEGDPEQIARATFKDGLTPYFSFNKLSAANDRRLDFNVSDGGPSMDVLYKGNDDRGCWTGVTVLCEDVRREWSFGIEENDNYRTGSAGRPSSWQLIETELDRRRAAALPSRDSMQEAASLAKWLRATHPKAPVMTPKTILNRFRKKIRDHVKA